jgi:hypothetical protein
MVIDANRNAIVAGARYDLTLEELTAFLEDQ